MSAHDWPRTQALSLHVPALGLLVDLSQTGLPDDALRKGALVTDAFPKAFAAMDALEKGAIANPDEKRRVGHYWLRAPELAPDPETAEAIRSTLTRIEDFAEAVHAGRVAPEKTPRFENLLVVGIGGSALGPQLVADALGSPRDPMKPFFFDNTDPDGMARELSRVAATEGGLPATLTVVISKSGGTKETRNGMLVAADAYRRAGLNFPKHAVAVTGAQSELDEVAAKGGWLERFPMWDWVGGRTSELSAVGLLPAALQGLDIQAMLSGAAACDEATRVAEVAKNPAALLALAWHHETGGRGAKDMVVLPYKDRLLLFSRYLQQLVMESLGKEKDLEGRVVHQGIAVYGNKGSTDQHAYIQQLREGVPNFFVTFLEVEKDRADGELSLEVEEDVTPGDYLHGFLLGTRKALSGNGRGSITVTLPDVSARTLGILIALYERAVGLYAQLVGVNAYHQPGVEAGKKAATAVLALQGRVLAELRAKRGELRTAEKIAAALSESDVETVFAVLRHLAANPDHAVLRKDGPTFFLATFGIK